MYMLNKNTLGAKKPWGQSEAAIKWLYMRPKCMISEELHRVQIGNLLVLKMLYGNLRNISDLIIQLQSFKGYSHNLIYMIGYVTWPPFKPGACRPSGGARLVSWNCFCLRSQCVCVYVCVCGCVSAPEGINNYSREINP